MKALNLPKPSHPSGISFQSSMKSLVAVMLILALFLPELGHVSASPKTQRGQKNMRVNSTADTVDINPGDGNCADSEGMCTLRAAVMEANSTQGEGRIQLPGGTYTLVIPGTDEDGAASGDLDILRSMTIESTGKDRPVIQAGTSPGSGIDRVFHIRGTDSRSIFEINLEGITIQNGQAPSGLAFPKNSGGGLLIEGYTNIELKDVKILHNSAPDTQGMGGGFMACGADCKDKQAGGVSFENSQVSQNSAAGPGGGMVLANLEEFEMTATSVLDNTSSGTGGGAAIRDIGEVSTIRNTTIARNRSQSGGGLAINNGKVYLANSTISGNSSDGSGAGVYLIDASMVMLHATIANNKSGSKGGGIFAQDAEVEVGNSILAGNSAPENPDCSGNGDYDSAGFNLIQDPEGCSSEFDEEGDLTGEAPLLSPLANNGGNTLTHALDINSPAAHLIPVGKNGCGTSIKTDQRGKKRPGSFSPARQCEMGAWEAQSADWAGKPTRTAKVTVTPTKEDTLTPTLTETATETQAPADTSTPTETSTETPTETATATVTETATATSTATESPADTATPTMTSTTTSTATASASVTASPTKTRWFHRATRTPTLTSTRTRPPTITATLTITKTRPPTITATRTLTHTATSTATEAPENTATLTTTSTSTSTATATASVTASPTKTRWFHRATRTPTLTITKTSPPTITATLTPTDKPTSTRTRPPTITATRTPTDKPTRTFTPTKKPTRTPTRKPQATLGSTLTSSPTTSSYLPAATQTAVSGLPRATSTRISATSAYFTAIVRTPTPTLSPPPQGGIRTNTPGTAPWATPEPPEGFVRSLFSQPWLLILVAGISVFLGLIVIGLIIWLLFFSKGEDQE